MDAGKRESPWLTVPSEVVGVCNKIVGGSAYRAREGVNTLGANGVYWFRVKEDDNCGLMLVENVTEGAKKRVRQFPPTLIETELLYPLLRGQDVSRWHAEPSLAILMTHQAHAAKAPMDYETFKTEFSRAHSYLLPFRPMLQERARVKKLKLGWYSLGEVGPYTFSSYKLVWREQAADFTAAVVGSAEWHGTTKVILPDHKLMLISCPTENEAHYLCGVLNSSLVRLIVKGYVVETSTSVHVMEHIAVPQYEASNPSHRRLAVLSKSAHATAVLAKTQGSARAKLAGIETELDEIVAETWDISRHELQQVAKALKVMDRISARPTKKSPSSIQLRAAQARLGLG